VSVSAAKIEPYREGIVRRFLANALYQPEERTDELEGLRAELAEAEEELRELIESREPIPAAVLAARGKVLQTRVTSAQEALEQAEAKRELPLTFPSSSEAWEALSIPEKRRSSPPYWAGWSCAGDAGSTSPSGSSGPTPRRGTSTRPVSAGLDEELATRLAERFVALYREEHADVA
jgi:hypothetical protein